MLPISYFTAILRIETLRGSSDTGFAQNNGNRRVEKSYGVLDLPSQAKITVSYDLPFGPKRQFVTSGAPSHILGNWTVTNASGNRIMQAGLKLVF